VVTTGLSAGVPGNIALAALVHQRHGRLPWAALFAPAIALARDGWALTPRFVGALDRSRTSAAHDPAALALFYDAEGRQVGSHLGELSHASLARALAKLKEDAQ
jgi:gamma-glutamyltranspeptidase/glutathione hydrolase